METYSSILPHSEREFPIRGLNLIRLLIQNRIADFHTTLESLPLPADKLIANPFIRHPVNLERWLMEGSYSKVWNAREEAPAEEYKFFVDSLMGTIRFVFFFTQVLTLLFVIDSLKLRCDRNEIASCEEAAYESLPLKDAATLLFFRSQSEVLDFAKQVRAQDLDMRVHVLTPSYHLSAGLAGRLDTRADYIHSKGRGEAGDTKREADRQ
jgi:26S proteasome regulatory subunit N12